jgi:hypothetical protein
MGEELRDEHTVYLPVEIATELVRAWRILFDETPSKGAIYVLLAHGAYETGWWHSCHCNNLGNKKYPPSSGLDWCFFECGEDLTEAEVARYIKADPELVYIHGRSGTKLDVRFKPKHPMCRFAAFKTLHEGAIDYLGLLHRRYSGAWPYVLLGDPVGFVRAIKAKGYFTGPLDGYLASVESIFLHSLPRRMPADWSPLAVDNEPEGLSDADRQRIRGLVALTAAAMTREALEPVNRDDGNA